MSFNHSVSDLVARIRNGYLANKSIITIPVSKLTESILAILKEEGYILSYSRVESNSGFPRFDIHLKYHYSKAVVSEIKVISTPGKRVYCRNNEIPSVKNGLGTMFVSTSQGILTDYQARSKKLGGELLFLIF